MVLLVEVDNAFKGSPATIVGCKLINGTNDGGTFRIGFACDLGREGFTEVHLVSDDGVDEYHMAIFLTCRSGTGMKAHQDVFDICFAIVADSVESTLEAVVGGTIGFDLVSARGFGQILIYIVLVLAVLGVCFIGDAQRFYGAAGVETTQAMKKQRRCIPNVFGTASTNAA